MRPFLVALLALALAASSASADIDVETGLVVKATSTLSPVQATSEFQVATHTWRDRTETGSKSGTYSIDTTVVPGTVLVNVPGDKPGDNGDILRLFPGTGASTFLASDSVLQNGSLLAIVLVREGSGLGVKDIAGPSKSSGFILSTSTYSAAGNGSPAIVGDLGLGDEDLSATFDGTTAAAFQQTSYDVNRDPGTAGGVSVTNGAGTTVTKLSLTSTGVLRVTPQGPGGPLVGCISADGNLGFLVNDPQTATGEHQLVVFIGAPPPK